VAKGGSEAQAESDKVPCSTSKFHFSKGKYGNIVLAWHGVLMQKAEASFPNICTEARKVFGVTDLEKGNGNQLSQSADPEIRNRVGLDSEPESESEVEDNADDGRLGDDEDHASSNDLDNAHAAGENDDVPMDDGNADNRLHWQDKYEHGNRRHGDDAEKNDASGASGKDTGGEVGHQGMSRSGTGTGSDSKASRGARGRGASGRK